MNQESKQPKFLCEKTFSWMLGLLGCAGLFYFMAVTGANKTDPISIALFFGSIYFLFKIFLHVKSCLIYKHPSLKRNPKNPEVKVNESKIFAPFLITILFGLVGAWLFLIIIAPSSSNDKLLAMTSGLILVFIGSYLWLNKNT